MGRLFGTDGIRSATGVGPLTVENVFHLGQVLGEVLQKGKNTVIIGRDTRASSQSLQDAIMAGLLSHRVDIIDMGVIPTPAVSWAVKFLKAGAGVMITASHNPAHENGIKLFDDNGQKYSESLENEIEDRMQKEPKQDISQSHQLGKLFDGAFLRHSYTEDLVSQHRFSEFYRWKGIIDCANGAGSMIAPETFMRCGLNVITVNSSPNGNNINLGGGAEYIRRRASEACVMLKNLHADFYIAFDGDADRVIFIDSEGHLIDGDYALGILASYYNKQNRLQKHTVATSIMRNTGLINFLNSQMIDVIETPVGDKHITASLAKLDASLYTDLIRLGAEQSGHFVILNQHNVAADGLRTALHLLEVSLHSRESLASLTRVINKVPQIIASVYVGKAPRMTDIFLDEFSNTIRDQYPQITRLLLRYSGTEDLFRIMAESNGTTPQLVPIVFEIIKRVQGFSQCYGDVDVLDAVNGKILELLR